MKHVFFLEFASAIRETGWQRYGDLASLLEGLKVSTCG
jgi:hypothetical protein